MMCFVQQMNDNKKKQVKISRAKRADLAKEFEEFKQKIQEFDDKNQQVINRIRQAYTYKRKAIENQSNYRQAGNLQRVVYYDQGDEESVSSSCSYSKNMVLQGNLIGISGHSHDPQPIQAIQYQAPPYSSQMLGKGNQSQPFFRSSNLSSRAVYSTQAVPSGNYTKPSGRQQFQDYESRKSKKATGKFIDEPYNWQEKMRKLTEKNTELEETISAQQQQLERIREVGQNRIKSYASTMRRLVSEQIQNYHQEIVLQRLLQMQKYFRKCDNRLRKLQLHLKDSLEDRKARTAIKKSRAKRRSSSKSKYNQRELSSGDMRQSWASGPNRQPVKIPTTKKGDSQQRSTNEKQKQFTQIAAGYETMIKAKTEQIQRLEKQIKEQIKGKEGAVSELSRVKFLLEQSQKTIEELKTPVKNEKEEELFKENKQLKENIQKIQDELRYKQKNEKQLTLSIQKLERAKKSSNEEQKQSLNKTISKKNQMITELQQKLKESQSIYLKEIGEMKDKILDLEKKSMEKQCEILTHGNKLKKAETDILLKDQKIKEFESLLTKDNDPDLLERSMSVDTSLLSSHQFRSLQEALRRQQDESEHKLILIQELEKQKYDLQAELELQKTEHSKLQKDLDAVKRKVTELQREDEEKDTSHERENIRQLQERLTFLEEGEKERLDLIDEREQLVSKNNSLLQQLKKLKEENLTLNRDIIKINSKLSFNQSQYSGLQAKLLKSKDQNTDIRSKLANQISSFEAKQKDYLNQIKSLKVSLEECQKVISELQMAKQGEEHNEENLLNSIHVSELSFNVPTNKAVQEEEMASLKEKLKEAETALQLKQTMEQQIQSQYRQNLDRIRIDLNDKNTELKRSQSQIEELRKQIKLLHQQQKQDVSFENYKISLYEEKIVQLQAQCNTCHQSEAKLNQLLHQLTENMRDKSEEKVKLLNELEQKEKALQQLKELLEIKEIKDIQSSKQIKETNKEEGNNFFLRMSGDQSEEMSDMAEVSYFSNISDVFKRDDVLQQKMKRGKTSREEFVRLFTKTSAYIKSLKGIIETKDKRIKSLERQLGNLKNQEKDWSHIKNKKVSQTRAFRTQNDREDSIEEYKDYDSVQIDTRRSKSYEIMKELQHEKALAVQENKMLMNQIQLLQDELLRAEEQENSLVRIKDLYKDEIKKLMEKNEGHTQEFELQIKRLRDELDQSESYHNWEALKQLFIKIIGCVAAMEDHSNKTKREEKRKQLQQFVKVLTSILKLQPQLRDKLVASIRK